MSKVKGPQARKQHVVQVRKEVGHAFWEVKLLVALAILGNYFLSQISW